MEAHTANSDAACIQGMSVQSAVRCRASSAPDKADRSHDSCTVGTVCKGTEGSSTTKSSAEASVDK